MDPPEAEGGHPAGEAFPTDECLAADVAFPGLVASSGRSPRLRKVHRQLADQIHFLRYFQAGRMRASIPEHRAIIRALLRRDAAAAEQDLRAHARKLWEHTYGNRHLL